LTEKGAIAGDLPTRQVRFNCSATHYVKEEGLIFSDQDKRFVAGNSQEKSKKREQVESAGNSRQRVGV
jgi:hypothetical protein